MDGTGRGKVSEVMCDQRVPARTKGEVRTAVVRRQGEEQAAAEVKTAEVQKQNLQQNQKQS